LATDLSIVARGELAGTESKLLQAGADKVVLPSHIGPERIAELLLYEESARFMESLERSHGFQRVLHNFGVEVEVVTAAPNSPAVRMTVGAIERKSKGAFFIVQINRGDGDVFTNPPAAPVVGRGLDRPPEPRSDSHVAIRAERAPRPERVTVLERGTLWQCPVMTTPVPPPPLAAQNPSASKAMAGGHGGESAFAD
jgi:hypothetical protein